MKKYEIVLKKLDLAFSYSNHTVTFTKGHNYYIIKVNTFWLAVIGSALLLLAGYLIFRPQSSNSDQFLENSLRYQVMEDFLSGSHFEPIILEESTHQAFIQNKAAVIYKYTTENRVSRIEQLNPKSMLKMASEISDLFIQQVLKPQNPEAHVWQFFADTSDLNKIKTAVIEQTKYHIPASIKLAQAILETGYGRKVTENNYFGLKDKNNRTKPVYTLEYYTEKEYQANKIKVLEFKKIRKRGLTLYKCKIKDSFKGYTTPWHSFRDHSLYLNHEQRYASLFTNGKNYEAWADKIGSTRLGGLGYATSPVYGEVLKAIIRRYHLDLLDH